MTALFVVIIILCSIWLLARYLYLRVRVHEQITGLVVLQIAVPVKNDKTPISAEQMFQSLHGILRGKEKSNDHYSFEIVATAKGIFFVVVCPKRYQTFVENQLYAQYPQAQIKTIQDYTKLPLAHSHALDSEITLTRPAFLPIKTFTSFQVDPLASITSTISKLDPGYEVWIQILLRPLGASWQQAGKQFVNFRKSKTDSEGKKVALESGESQELSEVERKNSKVGFQFVIRILVKGPDEQQTNNILEDLDASFKQFQTGQFNSLARKKALKGMARLLNKMRKIVLGKRQVDKLSTKTKYSMRFLDEHESGIINIEEAASIFHLPYQSVETPGIAWARSKKLEPPQNLPIGENVRKFAYTDYRNSHVEFGLKMEDRRRHMYILGKTGTGKTTLLKNLIAGDVKDGKGFAVVDPHGDLIEEVMALIPEERIKDVVILDPSDREFPVGLNMLDMKEGETMDLLADGIVSVFKKYFGNSWGPRLQYILTNTILTLLHCQNVSLLAVQRILVDKNYRTFLLKQVDDPFLHQFWEQEYEAMSSNPRLLAEALAPIQNKVGRFLGSAMVRNMVGQVKSNIDLENIMNTGKILLVNLSQGKIGEENSSLLGGMIITRLYANAMQRASIPESERRDFYLYVDEFQNFATETFVKILSEARKYALNLIVTHQYIDQLLPEIQTAVFGNVGTIMNFVVGQQDANRLAKEFAPDLAAEDLVHLSKYRLAMKLMIDGAQSQPFTAVSMPPPELSATLREKLIASSRELYAKPRELIEDKLNKWSSQKYNSDGNLVQN